jgi:tRNA A37 threonylcarbamoyladenosine biosynthesis protein TsaE
MDKIVKDVVDKYAQRSEVGVTKYGTTLEGNTLPLIEWLNHLQEELMDATLYIQKLKSELEQQNPRYPDGHVITKESWDSADKITHDGYVYVKFTDLCFYK